MFELKSNIVFKSARKPLIVDKKAREDEHNVRTMNLDAERFKDLLELYPDTE